MSFFFFQAEDGIRDFCLSRGLGDVYKRQVKEMLDLSFRSSKMGFLLFMCLSLPLISILEFVLEVWLVTPPPLSWNFCLLSLIYMQCNSLSGTLQNIVQATGNVKRFQLSNGLIKIMALPAVYTIYLSLIHISEPTRQAEISYAVFCLKKKTNETSRNLVCRILLDKTKKNKK